MIPSVETDIQTRQRQIREQLDQWTREVIAWHFDPESGTPFWLEWAAKAGWDPRREIRGYDDLVKFGHFQDEWLRSGPLRRWVPQAYAHLPLTVFEMDGGAGAPRMRIEINDYRFDYEQFGESLPEPQFPKGADWLSIAPTGPRRLRLSIEHLAQCRGGICFMVDLDPRWIYKVTKSGRRDRLERYQQHVTDQALTLLRAHPNIQCVFATPKLLEALCEKVSLRKLGIKGVVCGGEQLTPEFCRRAAEEMLDGVYLAPVYVNALTGLAPHKPLSREDGYAIVYYPPLPRAVFEVVDPVDTERVVGYGETGRLMLTALTKEFFMPRFLEREEAERERPHPLYPVDGVRNVRPLSGRSSTEVAP